MGYFVLAAKYEHVEIVCVLDEFLSVFCEK
jgi:hypothetical protein